ncbi:uncharacterized protein LOC143989317 isoform X2 [Lithobates pipiens]
MKAETMQKMQKSTLRLKVSVHFQITMGPTTFQTHFAEIVANAPVDEKGDLGRHGKGPAYNHLSKNFMHSSQSGTQTHNALLMEFSDSTRKRKTYRLNVECWRERKTSKKGIYVSPIKKGFPFRTTKVAPVKGRKTVLDGLKAVTDTSSAGPKSDKAPVKGRKTGLEVPKTVKDTGLTGPKSDKAPVKGRKTGLEVPKTVKDTGSTGPKSDKAPGKGRKPCLEEPQTMIDTSSTGPKSDKEPLRSTDIPKKSGSTTSINKNYGPCW